jgi:hypothetical protein
LAKKARDFFSALPAPLNLSQIRSEADLTGACPVKFLPSEIFNQLNVKSQIRSEADLTGELSAAHRALASQPPSLIPLGPITYNLSLGAKGTSLQIHF